MAEGRPGPDGEHIGDALLSAYLDDDVERAETRRMIEDHLRDCDACRARLDELRLVVGLLASLPAPKPRRSFQLTPEMLERTPISTRTPVRRVELQPEVWYLRFQPALRWATAVAAIALVLLFGADLLTHQTGGGSTAGRTTEQSFTTSSGSSASSGSSSSGGSASTVTSSSAASSAKQSGAGLPASVATPAANADSLHQSTAGAAGTPTARALAASNQTRGAPPRSPAGGGSSGPSGWRLAELALALLVAWLLFMSVALPRLRRARI